MTDYKTVLSEQNRAYYLAKFRKFDQLGPGLHMSWNWPAFLIPGAWTLYRGMYGWFFTLWFIIAIVGVFEKTSPVLAAIFFLLLGVLFAIFADSLYHRSIVTKIAAKRRCNVNTWVPWAVASLPVIGISAAIVIPAMTSAPKALTPVASPPPVNAQTDDFDAFLDEPRIGDLPKPTPATPVGEPAQPKINPFVSSSEIIYSMFECQELAPNLCGGSSTSTP